MSLLWICLSLSASSSLLLPSWSMALCTTSPATDRPRRLKPTITHRYLTRELSCNSIKCHSNILKYLYVLLHSRKHLAWSISVLGRPCYRWTTLCPITRRMTTPTSVWMEKTVQASSAALTTAAQVPGVKTGCTCEFPRLILTHEYSFPLLLAFSTWFIG